MGKDWISYPTNLGLTAIGLTPIAVTEDSVCFLTYAWYPSEFGELLLEEKRMNTGWPGTSANALCAHIGRMGLNGVLFSR